VSARLRVDVVEEAVAALLSGVLDPELAERARREAHKLSGSLGTFGMPAGTDHARALETAFEAGGDPAAAPELAEHVTALRRIVEDGPAGAPAAAAPVDPRDVALVGLPSPRDAEIVRALGERGIVAVAAEDAGGATVALAAGDDLEERVRILAERGARVAAIVTADADPVELVRCGALRLLPESLASEQIAEELAALLGGGRRTQSRVLVVDDDPDVLARARDVLSAAGHGVTTLEDPAGFWALLERSRPTSSCSTCRCRASTASPSAARCGRTPAGPPPRSCSSPPRSPPRPSASCSPPGPTTTSPSRSPDPSSWRASATASTARGSCVRRR
jgi:HPt (histidine-containing phosphotransfer) domain-containing protein